MKEHQAAPVKVLGAPPQPEAQHSALFSLFWQCFQKAGVALNARDEAVSRRLFTQYDGKEQERIVEWVAQQVIAGPWRTAEYTANPVNALRSEGWRRKAQERIVPKPMTMAERIADRMADLYPDLVKRA